MGSQTEVVSSPGDFRYLPSTTLQAPTGGIPERFVYGRESVSVLNNVTVRETKRAKARASDIDYQRRCSSSPSALRASIGLPIQSSNGLQGGSNHQQPNTHWGTSTVQQSSPNGRASFPVPPDLGYYGSIRQRSPSLSASSIYSDDGEYVIHLAFEDQRVEHRVTPIMLVDQLAEEAADVFGLDSHGIILVLFGAQPHTLQLQRRLLDPPPVGPGATVLIFDVRMGARNQRLPPPAIQNAIPDLQEDHFSSKLLANFKLPTFDGISRNWKPWNKTFIRFLAIHQLDGVIEENFMSVLPLTPRAFAANKMVYYLLEDAIVPSSLAAKYFRLAAKWNGNEAYSRLFNGYVFSGPQTMSLLLSQLVNLRFKANESASGFCL
jgi:hypothetical protein